MWTKTNWSALYEKMKYALVKHKEAEMSIQCFTLMHSSDVQTHIWPLHTQRNLKHCTLQLEQKQQNIHTFT